MSSRSNLWKFLICVAIALVAIAMLWLPRQPSASDISRATPVAPEARALARVKASAHQAEFAALVEQARARSANTSPFPSWEFTVLRDIIKEQNIDLSKFFPEQKIDDPSYSSSLSIRNSHILSHLLETANVSAMITLQIAPDALSGLNATQRTGQLSKVEEILRARMSAWADENLITTRREDDTIMVVISHLRNLDIINRLQNSWLVEFRLVHPFQHPTLQPNEEIPINYEILSADDDTHAPSEYLFVHRRPMADGRIIANAFPLFDAYNNPQIAINFTQEGRAKFRTITGQVAEYSRQLRTQTGQPTLARLAIVLDGKLLSYPGIAEEIDNDSALITGRFTVFEAHELAMRLNTPHDIPIHATGIQEITIPSSASQYISGPFRIALYILIVAAICMAVRFAFAIKQKNAQAILPPPNSPPPFSTNK